MAEVQAEVSSEKLTDLVLFPNSDGVHPGVPGSAHDIAQILVLGNLICCHADLHHTIEYVSVALSAS